MNKKSIIFLITAIILILITLVIIIDNEELNIKKVKLKYNNLPAAFDGYKIVQLSDLHNKVYGTNNKDLIKKIDKQSPDIIVMTGDMIDIGENSYNIFFSLVENLVKKYPIYYVDGNHEERLMIAHQNYIYDKLRALGVHVLNNENITLTKNNQNITIYGLKYSFKYYTNANNGDIDANLTSMNKILGKPNRKNFSILLTHNPTDFDTYSKWGADLILCGHMHGGMIRLPILGGVISPERTLFPKYDAGLFKKNNNKMFISKGLGTGIGIRVFCTAELVTITLYKN